MPSSLEPSYAMQSETDRLESCHQELTFHTILPRHLNLSTFAKVFTTPFLTKTCASVSPTNSINVCWHIKSRKKTRKLVVAGPCDSGKTSWAYVFHRIIPPQYIASITNEGQFSAAMINNDTQLIIIDKWSASTMTCDLAKTILQGGWMVSAVKLTPPKQINCHSPFYITTNKVPDFRDENENVERRIHVFNTSSLSTFPPSRLALISGYSTKQQTASPGLYTN